MKSRIPFYGDARDVVYLLAGAAVAWLAGGFYRAQRLAARWWAPRR